MVVAASGHEVNLESFQEYTHETARYFVKLYPWYYMPPTIHKFLIHGTEIISNALLPIGQFSEEAQEARNKDFKKYRECYSRKMDRIQIEFNQDILNMFLISSDPIISCKRKLPEKKLNTFPNEALSLLKVPELNEIELNESEESETDIESD